MHSIADLLFEARQLKEIPRSGYHFLGMGRESVAEHSFQTTFLAYVLASMNPDIDALRLISMCLLHDMAEARTGDLNTVHKRYVTADEDAAVRDLTRNLPFGRRIRALLEEFNAGETEEAQLARDADQLAFVLDLKALADAGFAPPRDWLPAVAGRMTTPAGRGLAESVLATSSDHWWRNKPVDSPA